MFRFYAALNDFLPPERRDTDFLHFFLLSPSINDVIEALGVAHTEVQGSELQRRQLGRSDSGYLRTEQVCVRKLEMGKKYSIKNKFHHPKHEGHEHVALESERLRLPTYGTLSTGIRSLS